MSNRQEIENYTRGLKSDLAMLQQAIRDKTQKMNQICNDICNKIQKPLSDLSETVESATKGSHIGASQCLTALSSAENKVRQVQSILGNESYYGCPAFSEGAGKMIHVTSDISATASSVQKYSEQFNSSILSVSQAERNLSSSNQSQDTLATSVKIIKLAEQMTKTVDALNEFTKCLDNASKRYKDCQEKAIARANRIPK